jgi:hypothetical protein
MDKASNALILHPTEVLPSSIASHCHDSDSGEDFLAE